MTNAKQEAALEAVKSIEFLYPRIDKGDCAKIRLAMDAIKAALAPEPAKAAKPAKAAPKAAASKE